MGRRAEDPDPRLSYHYSREERLEQRDAPDLSRREASGVFRGNRSLIVLLVDILLISLLFLVYRFVLYSPPHQGKLEGYTMALDALYAVSYTHLTLPTN